MFSKFGSKEATTGTPATKATPASAMAKTEAVSKTAAAPATAPPKAQPKPKPNLSIIGKSVQLNGELTAAEDLLIEGKLEGSVRNKSQNLVVGKEGKVNAELSGKTIVVQGAVNGDIRGAESVAIESSASVEGNISASTIAVEKGARFKGSIDTLGTGGAGSTSSSDQTRDGEISNDVVDKILDA